ncbi:hypothetical protein ACM26W_14970 [Halomonas sp. HK25]|uniref:hypothetical protein n=1 Tax=Halomonas sp. HK25 TaxID=3394321 RepID=UPI0039FCDDB7
MSALAQLLVTLLRAPRQVTLMLLTALAYAGLYLWLTGDLAGGGQGGIDARFPAWQRLFEARSAFQFEPVGLITLGALVWTFSPLNLLLALLLGLLVGLNLIAGWRLWRAPRACGLKRSGSSGTGLLAAIPALLAGGACCAPLVLIWLGLPIAGAVASLSPLLIPLAVLLLLVGLWGMARRLEVAEGGQLDDAEHSRR